MGDQWISKEANPYVVPQQSTGDAWADEAAASGRRGTSELLHVGRVPMPTDVALGLGLPANGEAIVRRRLILADDRPYEIAASYYPPEIAEGTELGENRKIRGGAVRALADLGYEAATVRESITARLTTSSLERELLQLGSTDPVIVQTRVTLDAHGVPYEFAVNTMVAAGRHLDYEMRIS